MQSRSGRRQGSMLIVALGVLTLLSILAVTFVSLMRLELRASKNYVDGVKARLIAEGGLEKALAELKNRGGVEPAARPEATWNYAEGNYNTPLEDARIPGMTDSSGKVLVPADPDYQEHDIGTPGQGGYKPSNRVSFWGLLGRSYDRGYDRYKVSVVDAQTQFNLNNTLDHDTYIRWLSSLGAAISKAQGKPNPVLRAMYPRGGGKNARFGAEAIYTFRESREGKTFTSKSELQEILATEDDWKALRPYLTTKSWFDRNAVDAMQLGADLKNKPWSDVDSPRIAAITGGRLDRAPINLNLAAREVIAANLAGLAGRSIYIHVGDYNARATNGTLQHVDQGTKFEYSTKNEDLVYGPQGYVVYVTPFGYTPPPSGDLEKEAPEVSGALAFADLIVKRRKTVGPFFSYAEWDRFVDQAVTESLLGTSTGGVSYPQPSAAKIYTLQHDALNSPTLEGEIKGSARFRAFYQDMIRSVLKANANPNARVSSFNPNSPAYLEVDKGSLFYPKDIAKFPAQSKALTTTQTCEWCFAPKGVFEVMALGEVIGNEGPATPYAQSKILTVVQLFDTIGHTSQRDFERLGKTFEGEGDRLSLMSYPISKLYWDPRVATDTASQPIASTTKDEWLEKGGDPDGRRAHDIQGHLELGPLVMRTDSSSRVFAEGAFGPDLFALLLDGRRAITSPPAPAKHWDHEDNFVANTANKQKQQKTLESLPTNEGAQSAFAVPHGDPNDEAYKGFKERYQRSPEFLWDQYKYEMLYADGFNTSELRNKVLWYRASDSKTTPQKPEPWPSGNPQGTSALAEGNCYPTNKGAVDFWYKPEFDWFAKKKTWTGAELSDPTSDPIKDATGGFMADDRFCGLIGTSHVAENDAVLAPDPAKTQPSTKKTRGTQMFVVRTTSGDLRITRLYFECIGPANSKQEFPLVRDIKVLPAGVKLITLSEYMKRASADTDYTWPPIEFQDTDGVPGYSAIKFARVDAWVPGFPTFLDWRAHEWHHVAVHWDDATAKFTVYLDGQLAQGMLQHEIGPAYKATINTKGGAAAAPPAAPPVFPTKMLKAFVRLNAKANPNAGTYPLAADKQTYEWPKDLISIGCVYREQAEKGGVFKFVDKARVPANGTIDDVRFYDGVNTGPGATGADPSRYPTKGYWTNELDLSDRFGADDALQLGQLGFTAYLPTHWGSARNPDGAGSVTVEASIVDPDGKEKQAFPAAVFDRVGSSGHLLPLVVAGQPVVLQRYATGAPGGGGTTTGGPAYRYDKIRYRITLKAALYDKAAKTLTSDDGFAVATPVLDDVWVVYYLPTQRILLKEKVND